MSLDIKYKINQYRFYVSIIGVSQKDKHFNGFKKQLRNALVNIIKMAELINENLQDLNTIEINISKNRKIHAIYKPRTKRTIINLNVYNNNSISREKIIFHELVHRLEDSRFDRNYPSYVPYLKEGMAVYFTYFFYRDTNDLVRTLIKNRFEKNYKLGYSVGFYYISYLFNNKKKIKLFLLKDPSEKIRNNQEHILESLGKKNQKWFMQLIKSNTDFIIKGKNKYHCFIYRRRFYSAPIIITFDYSKSNKINNGFKDIVTVKDKRYERFNDIKSNSFVKSQQKLYKPLSYGYANIIRNYPDIDMQIDGNFKLVEP